MASSSPSRWWRWPTPRRRRGARCWCSQWTSPRWRWASTCASSRYAPRPPAPRRRRLARTRGGPRRGGPRLASVPAHPMAVGLDVQGSAVASSSPCWPRRRRGGGPGRRGAGPSRPTPAHGRRSPAMPSPPHGLRRVGGRRRPPRTPPRVAGRPSPRPLAARRGRRTRCPRLERAAVERLAARVERARAAGIGGEAVHHVAGRIRHRRPRAKEGCRHLRVPRASCRRASANKPVSP
jgi:hypothetical protein